MQPLQYTQTLTAIAPPSLSGYSYNNYNSLGDAPLCPTTRLVFGRDPIANEIVLAIAPPSLSGYSYNNYNSLRAAPLYPTTSLVFGRDPIDRQRDGFGYRTSFPERL